MDFAKSLHKIVSFLRDYEPLWNREILNYYPESLDHYPEEWVDELMTFNNEELWQIDSNKDYSKLNNVSFLHFLKTIDDLTKLEKIETHKTDYPGWAFQKVSNKKNHEIKSIAPILEALNISKPFNHGVDIGGGMGHLSRILSHYHKIPFYSLDCDGDLQKKGQLRDKKYPRPEKAKALKFINTSFGPPVKGYQNTESEKDKKNLLKELFSKNSLSVGLHTCGPLAIHHFNSVINNKGRALLNFACCYNKLNPKEFTNLSSLMKKDPLEINLHALTLASRPHLGESFETFLMKKKVKLFRYSLHILLYNELGIKEFITLGKTPLKMYQGDFSDYALLKMKELNISHNFTGEFLNSYINEEAHLNLIKRLFCSNLIRWQFNRVVELYLIFDRCLYLEENGYSVKLNEYFNPSLSPQNIGILAMRDN